MRLEITQMIQIEDGNNGPPCIRPVTLSETFSCEYKEIFKTPILKNICERLYCWCFVWTFFRLELSKGNFWWNKNGHLLCEWLLKLVKIEKMYPLIKYLVTREKMKFLYLGETSAIRKSFVQNPIKNRKYFSVHQYQNFRKFRH